MKINNYNLVRIINRLQSYENMKLPQKIGYAISRTLRNVQSDYKLYEEQLGKVYSNYKEYFVVNKNDTVVTTDNGIPVVKEEYRADFDKELSELLNIEIEPDIYTIPEEVFDYEDNGKYDALSPEDITVLISILCKQK